VKRKPPFLMRIIQCSRCSFKDKCVAWGGSIPCLWEDTRPKRCLTFKPGIRGGEGGEMKAAQRLLLEVKVKLGIATFKEYVLLAKEVARRGRASW